MPSLRTEPRLPKFLRFVAKPTDTSAKELEDAQPVYIDGLPTGSTGPITIDDVTGLKAKITELEGKITALETAGP